MPLGQLDDDIGIQVVVSPSLPGLHHYQESPGGQWCLPAPAPDTSGQWVFTSEPPVYQWDLLATLYASAAASCCCQAKPFKTFCAFNVSSISLAGLENIVNYTSIEKVNVSL